MRRISKVSERAAQVTGETGMMILLCARAPLDHFLPGRRMKRNDPERKIRSGEGELLHLLGM